VKQTRIIMGMPITVEVADQVSDQSIERVFSYFTQIDERFSTYKPDSEISQVNAGLPQAEWSPDMRHVLDLCEQTRTQTRGYFNISHNGKLDPSGLVKGWAIHNAAKLLQEQGLRNFYIEAGGDIQVHGRDGREQPWDIGIRNPFNAREIVKVVQIDGEGAVATSGTYVRGEHIYNPLGNSDEATRVKSLSVVGPNIYEADRFATAAFAMDEAGIGFIEELPGFEGYMIDEQRIATYTSGFGKYVAANV
jgi:thiamine biosynthesis lipoprotein